jgi:transcriptional regulator of acetoin/glycerol metabolism
MDGWLQGSLQRSWERTRAAGMRPGDKALFHHLVSAQEMRRVQEAHRPLIEIARPDMEQLWRSMRSPHWVVLLIDTQGTIVHSMGDDARAPRELRLPLRCGRRLLEGEFGTTAPAVAVREAQASEVRGEEHFLDELRHFSCAAAPIFDLDGKVTGVLDVTGIDVPMDARALERVCIATRSIEARMYEQATDGFLVRLHEDPRFIGTPSQGLLRVREDGSILCANGAAQDMLGLRPYQRNLHLSQLFDGEDLRGLQHLGATVAARTVHARSGARFFVHVSARTEPPRRTRTTVPSRPSGPDPAWTAAFERAGRVFPHGLPVLLQGETGTGKEWFARALHEAHRPGKPFVAVNCAALAETLAEAELFGHVEGAYTGSRKGGAAGRIEQAHGGTLFLDEIGDMPMHLQTRLLRVLQERTLTRIGGQQDIPLDLLVISASHCDLAQMVAARTFREDLYFRLNGLKTRLPALRDRQDLDLLIDACLHSAAPPGPPAARLPDALRRRLHECAWPGNIRQLRHVLHVACLLAGPDRDIDADMLPEELFANAPVDRVNQVEINPAASAEIPQEPPAALEGASAPSSLSLMRHDLIARAIADQAGNVSAAARSLRISRTTIYKHLRRTPP